MGINTVVLEGQIPFEIKLHNAENEDKRSYAGFLINVKRNYKPEGNQYYPEDDIFIKAFGPTAEFVARNFNERDHIGIEGQLRREEDDENKDGEKIKGRVYVQADRVHFVGNPNGNGNGNGNTQTETKGNKGGKGTGKKDKEGDLNPLRSGGKKSLKKK